MTLPRHRTWTRTGLLAIALLSAAPEAMAHPHLSVVAKADILLDKSGKITAIRHVWTFDEAYSAFATTGMKKGPDGRIAEAELADLAKINVESLSDFKYFTFFRNGKTELPFDPPKEGYRLTFDGKALTLQFDLPLQRPIAPQNGQTLKIDDETIFVAFSLADGEAVRFEGSPGPCGIDIRRPATSLGGSNVPKLGEDFFNNLKSGFSDQYASTIRIVCK